MNARCGAVAVLLVAPVMFAVLGPSDTRQPSFQQNDARVVAALEPIRERHGLPALGGAIVTADGLTAAGVTGVRKVGSDTVATIDDLWHIGSDTKAMTAVVMARLVERGLLRWDSTIGAGLPDQTRQAPQAFKDITLLQLLAHRAGVVPNINWRLASAAAPTLRAQRLTAVEVAATTPLSSPPGTRYEYSNLGYVVAAAMGEAAADRAWEDLVRDSVFAPLGMTSPGFGGTGTPGQIDQPWPHGATGAPMPANGPSIDNPLVMAPAGGLHLSLADWARFVTDMLRGFDGRGQLLTPDTYAFMHAAPFGGNYAFGWLTVERSWAGGTAYSHAGSNTMNFVVAWVAPKKGVAVLLVTNRGGAEAQAGTDEAAGALISLANR